MRPLRFKCNVWGESGIWSRSRARSGRSGKDSALKQLRGRLCYRRIVEKLGLKGEDLTMTEEPLLGGNLRNLRNLRINFIP